MRKGQSFPAKRQMAARIPGSVRPDAADCLNLGTKPTVHHMPFGSYHGNIVAISTRPLTKRLLEKICPLMEAHKKQPFRTSQDARNCRENPHGF